MEPNIDRDARFRYINAQARAFLAANEPLISVDTKKKELLGAVKARLNWSMFTISGDPKLKRAVPYGVALD